MKKIIILFLLTFVMATSAFSEKKALPMQTHKTGQNSENREWIRTPISLPIVVFYDSDTNVLEVWCDNDNVQAEVFVYDETGELEAYSPYMNARNAEKIRQPPFSINKKYGSWNDTYGYGLIDACEAVKHTLVMFY